MKILFVDDEVMILNGIKRSLFRTGWDIKYVTSAAEALTTLKEFTADFIVSDMLMPGMNGADLLEKVSVLYPSTVRIILSGHADKELSTRASYVTHQWYHKPCAPDVLKSELERIHNIRADIPYDSITELLGGITSLPTLPSVFIKIKSLIRDENVSIEDISSLISESQTLTAKVLQVANNAYFVSSKKITSIENAIIRLGTEVVCNIAAITEVYSTFDNKASSYYSEILARGLSTAHLASLMVDKPIKDSTMLAALLHNIGELIFHEIAAENINTYLQQRIVGADNTQLEIELFKISNIQISSYLLHLWHFPYSLIECITLQNNPSELIKREFDSAVALYIAKALINKVDIDEQIVEKFDLSEKLELWRKEIQ